MSAPTQHDDESPAARARRTPAVIALAAIVGLEFLAVAVLVVILIVAAIRGGASDVAAGIALVLLAAVAAVWLGAIVRGLLRAQAWTRSAIIVWQVIQGAVAIGAFQGVFRVPALGWVLLIPALIAVTLVLSRPVTRILVRSSEEER